MLETSRVIRRLNAADYTCVLPMRFASASVPPSREVIFAGVRFNFTGSNPWTAEAITHSTSHRTCWLLRPYWAYASGTGTPEEQHIAVRILDFKPAQAIIVIPQCLEKLNLA